MTNADIAAALEQLAHLLELLGEDAFRVSAHARAARAVEGSAEDLAALARLQPATKARAALTAIDGIGPKLADKIIELVTTGRLADLDDAASKVPAGLLPLLQLQGLGPKTVRMFWQDAGVTDLAGLQRIIADGRILSLPRMGAKAVEKLKAAIAIADQAGTRLALGRASVVAERVMTNLRSVPGVQRLEAAGSLRRGRDTVGDIDILVQTTDPAAAIDAFVTQSEVRQVLAKGERKASARVLIKASSRWEADDTAPAPAAQPAASDGPTVQVDLRVIDRAAFGAALAYFTGSKEHNVQMRQRAIARGLTLNEYGLFPETADGTAPHTAGLTPVASASEQDIYAALGLPYVPPELREGQSELTLTATPRLVELPDIRAELHAHTTASDGVLSIIQLATEAQRRGMHTLAITDHSQSSALAGGLKPSALRAHIRAIRAAQKELPGITLLAGSEVDILADGTLDYDDDLLAELDIVVASPHAALTQDSPAATARLIKAVSHPLVHILGHPTGRLVLKRRGLEPDMAEVIAAAKAHDTALEINAHWMRLDLRDTHIRAAVHAGCHIAINCDVHHPDDYDNLRFGITTARRGGLSPAQCLNTWDAPALHAWLKRKRR
jgi:DNA polymerase (family 10)